MLMGFRGEPTTTLRLKEHGSIKAPSKSVFLYPQISAALGPHQINVIVQWTVQSQMRHL